MSLANYVNFSSIKSDKMDAGNKMTTNSTLSLDTDDVTDRSELLHTYKKLDLKFRLACRQLRVLTLSLAHFQCRYDRHVQKSRLFRYSLLLHMTTLEGVQNMYYEYAERCATRLEDMEVTLARLGLLPDSDDVSISDSLSEDSDTHVSADEVDQQGD